MSLSSTPCRGGEGEPERGVDVGPDSAVESNGGGDVTFFRGKRR
jgi:hypothetical protein